MGCIGPRSCTANGRIPSTPLPTNEDFSHSLRPASSVIGLPSSSVSSSLGFSKGCSASCFIIFTIFSMGAITSDCVSFWNWMDIVVSRMHTKQVWMMDTEACRLEAEELSKRASATTSSPGGWKMTSSNSTTRRWQRSRSASRSDAHAVEGCRQEDQPGGGVGRSRDSVVGMGANEGKNTATGLLAWGDGDAEQQLPRGDLRGENNAGKPDVPAHGEQQTA